VLTDGANKFLQALNSQLKAAAAGHVVMTERPLTGNKIRTGSGRVRSRTFTRRPNAAGAKRFAKADYTHNEAQLSAMMKETQSLVARLNKVYHRKGSSAGTAPRTVFEAPTARNRYAIWQPPIAHICNLLRI
jgi:hypothetical protein